MTWKLKAVIVLNESIKIFNKTTQYHFNGARLLQSGFMIMPIMIMLVLLPLILWFSDTVGTDLILWHNAMVFVTQCNGICDTIQWYLWHNAMVFVTQYNNPRGFHQSCWHECWHRPHPGFVSIFSSSSCCLSFLVMSCLFLCQRIWPKFHVTENSTSGWYTVFPHPGTGLAQNGCNLSLFGTFPFGFYTCSRCYVFNFQYFIGYN